MAKRSKVGRPTKYDPAINAVVTKLCKLGLTDKQLAEYFEVDEDTIYEWKKKHPEFSEAIKKGKLVADANVAQSLYKRAMGFRFDEVTYEDIMVPRIDHAGNIIQEPGTKVKTVKKFITGDSTAMIFWLKNRRPDQWRDKHEINTTVPTQVIWKETKTYKK